MDRVHVLKQERPRQEKLVFKTEFESVVTLKYLVHENLLQHSVQEQEVPVVVRHV